MPKVVISNLKPTGGDGAVITANVSNAIQALKNQIAVDCRVDWASFAKLSCMSSNGMK